VPLYAINPDFPSTNDCKAVIDWFDFVMIVREKIASC